MNVEERAANLLQARLTWGQAEGCARDLAAAGLLVDDDTERRPTDYDELTDCPICPQFATDRDDALNEADALRARVTELEAAQATPVERELIDKAIELVWAESATDICADTININRYYAARAALSAAGQRVLSERQEGGKA